MPIGEPYAQQVFPPLFGDRQGHYRVQIVGNSGVGKSTLGAELARVLNVPLISLDRLFWGLGWYKTPEEEFRAQVRKALNQSDRGWVIDGKYAKRLGSMIETEATDTIWLDPPLAAYFPRIFLRTLRRLLGLTPPCSPGCDESAREAFFSRKSILWWCLTNHMTARKQGREKLRTDGLHVGGTYRRIGGCGRELAAWVQSVRDMIRAQSS